MSNIKTIHTDVVGIGFGPSNLATAVALADAEIRDFIFLEKNFSFSWHPDMSLKEANLQNSFLKDLITLRNPRSPFTFLNYLSEMGRIDDFVNRRTFFPTRDEITDYMNWAANSFSEHVLYGAIAHQLFLSDDDQIGIECLDSKSDTTFHLFCNSLILGIGAQPFTPIDLLPHPRGTHTADMLSWIRGHNFPVESKNSFLVIGGGQSSAEVLYHLLESYPLANIQIASRRYIYKSLEESAFINNLFSEKGMNWFSSATPKAQKIIFKDLYEANFSAVDNSLVSKIYEILYEERRKGKDRVQFHPYCETISIQDINNQFHCTLWDRANECSKTIVSQYAIFATGYRYTNISTILKPLAFALEFDEEGVPLRNDDYSLKTSPKFRPKIFAHAVGDKKFGFTEGGMTNLASRAYRMVESIQASRPVFV